MHYFLTILAKLEIAIVLVIRQTSLLIIHPKRMSVNTAVNRIGFSSGVIAFSATVAYVVAQLLQVIKILAFPIDEILIYGTSLCIVIPFVLEILALHYVTAPDKKFWSHAALIFSIIYAVFVTPNYVVQLATVIPMKLQGNSSQIRILEQTPHSLFWNFDAIGYIFMGLGTLIAIPIFEKQGFQKWVRISFFANALITPLIAIVYFYPTYSEKLLVLGFPWAVTAPLSMLMLALLFRKNYRSTLPSDREEKNKNSRRHKNIAIEEFS
jgi:hypothetical protein